jgi:hypothetical protein
MARGAAARAGQSETPDALEYVAAAIGQLVQVESMMISLSARARTAVALSARHSRLHRAAVLERYFSAGYLLDPFCPAVQSGLAEGFYHLQEIAPTTSSTATTTRPITWAPVAVKTATTSSTSAQAASCR